MAKTTTTMRDSNGHDVPLKYISAYDKKRDRVTRRIHARFVAGRKYLEKLLADCITDLDELKGGKEKLGVKGNFSAQSFDGLINVAIRQHYNIMLDERVIRARELMIEYVNGVLDRVSGADIKAIKLLVEEAFKANAQGFLSVGKVMSLMRMEVDNAKWREAKEILQAALKPQKGKQYLHVKVRRSTQEDFSSIRLDLADCWPKVEDNE